MCSRPAACCCSHVRSSQLLKDSGMAARQVHTVGHKGRRACAMALAPAVAGRSARGAGLWAGAGGWCVAADAAAATELPKLLESPGASVACVHGSTQAARGCSSRAAARLSRQRQAGTPPPHLQALQMPSGAWQVRGTREGHAES